MFYFQPITNKYTVCEYQFCFDFEEMDGYVV